MGKGKNRNTRDPASRVMERIRRAAKSIDRGAEPSGFFDDVLWMVERGFEWQVYELIDEEEFEDKTYAALEFALHEAGYRLYMPALHETDRREPSDEEGSQSVMVPFAFIFAVPVLMEDANNFPTRLPMTIRRASKKKIIRRILGLDGTDSVFLDNRLYRVDHYEWRRESAARRYMLSLASHVKDPDTRFQPLARDYKKAAGFAGRLDLDKISILQRAVCGAVLVSEGVYDDKEMEVEERLFEEREEGELDELARIIKEELASHLAGPELDVFILPRFVELDEVPESGLYLQRTIDISLEIERAMQSLLETVQSGEIIEPLLYVSRHGEDDMVEELRLAAYAREGEDEDPFFTYVWEVVHELEDPEEVSETIVDISKQLNARILLVDDLLPDERCGDCGEKLFQGPGGPAHGPD
ncbi:MAG: hypothetical protein L0229_07600 [Blastocatellia bacterium]|nr:hypothetical protein [Blastocatellia bacterium]